VATPANVSDIECRDADESDKDMFQIVESCPIRSVLLTAHSLRLGNHECGSAVHRVDVWDV